MQSLLSTTWLFSTIFPVRFPYFCISLLDGIWKEFDLSNTCEETKQVLQFVINFIKNMKFALMRLVYFIKKNKQTNKNKTIVNAI